MPPRMALYYIPASRPRSFVIAAQRKIEKPVRFGEKIGGVGGDIIMIYSAGLISY